MPSNNARQPPAQPQQPYPRPPQPGAVPPQGSYTPQPVPAQPQIPLADATHQGSQSQYGGAVPPTPPPNPPAPQQPQQPEPTAWYKKPTSWIIAALALSVLIFLMGVVAIVLHDEEESSDSSTPEAAVQTPLATDYEVTYRILGDSTDAVVSYNNGQSSNGQEQGVGAGWELTTTVSNTFGAYLFATNGIDQEGELICQVEANGVIIAEDATTGPLTDASCNPTNAELAAAFGD